MELIQSRGTIYGTRYYNVLVAGLPINQEEKLFSDMVAWNVENFGKSKWLKSELAPLPHQRWYAYSGSFWFRDKDDMIHFILRWS